MNTKKWNTMANGRLNNFIDKETTKNLWYILKGASQVFTYNKNGVIKIIGDDFESFLFKSNPNFITPKHKCCFDVIYVNPITGKRIGVQCKTNNEGSSECKIREANNTGHYDSLTSEEFINERKDIFNEDFKIAYIENDLDGAILLNLEKTNKGVILQYAPFGMIEHLNFSKICFRKKSYSIPSKNRIIYNFSEKYVKINLASNDWKNILVLPIEKVSQDYISLGKEALCKKIVIPFFLNQEKDVNPCVFSYLNLNQDKKAGKNSRSLRVYDSYQQEAFKEKLTNSTYKVNIGKNYIGKEGGNILEMVYCDSRKEFYLKDINNSKNSFGLYISELLGIEGDDIIDLTTLKKKNIGGLKFTKDPNDENMYTLSLVPFNDAMVMY